MIKVESDGWPREVCFDTWTILLAGILDTGDGRLDHGPLGHRLPSVSTNRY